jgi:pimeloyl-ACP methyl ester carboxylesterase
MLEYVAARDPRGLLGTLEEDGAFGCWTFSYPGRGRVSRDLLESVNELCFLDRQLELSARERFAVLDIGAGYGRLAHRMAAAYPDRVTDICCVDAVPESTFLSEYYLRHRGAAPPARVVSLGRVEAELVPGSFDLAVNVHSFSECTLEAIAWWVDLLARLAVPSLLIVPNEPQELLSLEPDGSRRDFAPLLARAGYRLRHREPVLDDPAVRELVGLHDHFHLFSLEA